MPEPQTCPDCHATRVADDRYCRECGRQLVLEPEILPATREPRALARRQAAVPAEVRRAATAVAVGAALQLGVGMAGRFLARRAAKGAVRAITPRRIRGDGKSNVPAKASPGEVTVTETMVYQRVWVRRD